MAYNRDGTRRVRRRWLGGRGCAGCVCRQGWSQLRATSEGEDTELHRVRADLEEARGELAELRAAVGSGKPTVASLVAAEPDILARITGLERRERELTVPPALAGLLAPGRDVARRWAVAPVPAPVSSWPRGTGATLTASTQRRRRRPTAPG